MAALDPRNRRVDRAEPRRPGSGRHPSRRGGGHRTRNGRSAGQRHGDAIGRHRGNRRGSGVGTRGAPAPATLDAAPAPASRRARARARRLPPRRRSLHRSARVPARWLARRRRAEARAPHRKCASRKSTSAPRSTSARTRPTSCPWHSQRCPAAGSRIAWMSGYSRYGSSKSGQVHDGAARLRGQAGQRTVHARGARLPRHRGGCERRCDRADARRAGLRRSTLWRRQQPVHSAQRSTRLL